MHPTQRACPEFVSSLVDIGAAELVARYPVVSRTSAEAVMRQVADEVCGRFAGQQLYVPTGQAQRLELRDQAMRRQYAEDGPGGVPRLSAARAAQLAREHGLSLRRVHTILSPVKPGAGGRPVRT